jgi:hypothetical protein
MRKGKFIVYAVVVMAAVALRQPHTLAAAKNQRILIWTLW